MKQIYVLFCESPVCPDKVDEDQFMAAKQNGFETLLFNMEDLTSTDKYTMATKKIKPCKNLAKVIYRGWMLTPQQYSILYNDLLLKNYQLINTVQEYQNCHYLPDSLKFIENKTPKTIFEKIAKQIDSNFFSMDIARKENGELTIIELGDGQVAGLPDKTDRNEFYRKLKLKL